MSIFGDDSNDQGPGNWKNYDEKGRYIYDRSSNNGGYQGGGNGCLVILFMLTGGLVSSSYGLYQILLAFI